MDTPPINSVVIPLIDLETVGGLNALPVAPQAASAAPITEASTTFFSTLAQLLAATALSQTQQTATGTTGTDFNQLAANTEQFVAAFNNFQASSTSGTASSFDTSFDNAFLAALHAESTQSGTNSGQSFINSLAELGIHFQEASAPVNPNQFNVNWTELEAAYNANPVQTTALLTSTFQALSALEENLVLAQQTAQSLNQPASTTTLYDSVPASDSATLASQTNPQAIADTQATTVTVQTQLTDAALADAVTTSSTAEQVTAAATAAANATAIAADAATQNQVIANATAPTTNLANTTNVETNPDPTVIDPVIALAVAAYRVGETIEHNAGETMLPTAPETIEDVDKISPTAPLSLNLHSGEANNQGANSTATEQKPEHSVEKKVNLPPNTVDVLA